MNSSDLLRVGSLSSEHPIQRFSAALESPDPFSNEEQEEFAGLQAQLIHHVKEVFPDPRAARSVVVIPSLTIAPDLLAKIAGVQYYEERMLFALMLLRLPKTRLIYVTSKPMAPSIVDYYLNLLPGVPVNHARGRLTLLSCYDTSPEPLTLKILKRPRLLRRIRESIGDRSICHMTVFNATALERTLAVRLKIPLYGCDPARSHMGTKSGSRKVFRKAGVPLPAGFEDLHSVGDMVDALDSLKRKNPLLKRAAVKLDEGVSGEGNAVFSFEGAPPPSELKAWLHHKLPNRLRYEASTETWESFPTEFAQMGGVVEEWIEGETKHSPSMQGRIDPLGSVGVVSTHDQILGGPSGQIFLGCSFPAREEYRLPIQESGRRVGRALSELGVTGRYGVDFVARKTASGWEHFAVEVNVRKGGTTHPFLMLQFLTDGDYDEDTGQYHTASGETRAYYASDNVVNPLYRGFTPEDLTDISVNHGLHFHGATQEGVVFHLIGALSEFGKVGVLCISDTIANARKLYLDTVRVLDQEALAQEEARASIRVFGG